MSEVESALAQDSIVERFTFTGSGHLGPDMMRGIALMQEQVSRSMTHTMSAWLRTGVNVTVVQAEQKSFGVLLADVAELSYVCGLRVAPSGSPGILQLDVALASPIVDVLLGGPGRQTETRALTDIEEAIFHSVTDIIVRELSKGWQASALQLILGKRERDAHLQRMMPLTERLVQMVWTISMEEASGQLSVWLPAVTLSSAMKSMAAHRDRPKNHDDNAQRRMLELASQAALPVSLRLPSTQVTTRILKSLRPGEILRTSLPRTTHPLLHVANIPCFTAEAVSSGVNRGSRIVATIPQPLQQLASTGGQVDR